MSALRALAAKVNIHFVFMKTDNIFARSEWNGRTVMECKALYQSLKNYTGICKSFRYFAGIRLFFLNIALHSILSRYS